MMNWTLAEEEVQLKLAEALEQFSPERKIIEEILREERGPSLRERIGALFTRSARTSDAEESDERYPDEVVVEAGDLLGSRFLVWNRPPRRSGHGDF